MVKGISQDWRTKTYTLHDPSWDADEVCVLKNYYGDRDRQTVLSAAVEQTRLDDGSVVTRATLDRFKTIRRQLAVVSWTLKYEDGTPMPCEPEIIAQLPPAVADVIDNTIERLWEGLSAGQAADDLGQEREDRATFHGTGDAALGGADAGRAPHDRAGAGDPGANGAAPADAPSMENVRHTVVGG